MPETTPPLDVLVKCEDFPQQTFTSAYGFSIYCPSDFSWEGYSNPYEAVFLASVSQRTTEGAISISIYHNDSATVRDWISAHSGPPNSGKPRHFWSSTSNLSDTQVAGRTAVSFDASALGPGPPPTSRGVAFLMPDTNIFVLAWGAYSSAYAATLADVSRQMIASVRV